MVDDGAQARTRGTLGLHLYAGEWGMAPSLCFEASQGGREGPDAVERTRGDSLVDGAGGARRGRSAWTTRSGGMGSLACARAACGQGKRRCLGMHGPTSGGRTRRRMGATGRRARPAQTTSVTSPNVLCLTVFDRRLFKIFKQSFKSFEYQSCRASIRDNFL
jgi:hypothetical protein